jgi:hypothetical protein
METVKSTWSSGADASFGRSARAARDRCPLCAAARLAGGVVELFGEVGEHFVT